MARRARRNSLHEVETSPDGRYIRFDEKLGSGAYKDVYLCYDTETGQEVAWNTVHLDGIAADEQQRIRGETDILRQLSHPGIISFGNAWENAAKDEICFTTEIVTSGTLKQYINRVKGIKLKVVKNWCRQLLYALDYLHHLSPPIIHRDLKCDNIFMNGSTGEVLLADFGLSRARHAAVVESVLGTPEFIAPELYEQHYNESVDIYAAGMCVLEMITKEYPFEECSNAAQIWRKVSQGIKPLVLQRIEWSEVRAFIELLISPANMRPTARELLHHPFLVYSNPAFDDRVCPVREKEEAAAAAASAPTPVHKHAAQQVPHLPVAPSPSSQQVAAQLQTAPVHSTQSISILSSPTQPSNPAAVTSHHQRTRSPTETITPSNLQPTALNRQRSHEQHEEHTQQPQQPQQQQHQQIRERERDNERDTALPAPYVGLTLNTNASSTRSPSASSPSRGSSPQHAFFGGTQRTSGVRPPSISTQQPHQSASAAAARPSHQASVSSPSHAQSSGKTPNYTAATPHSFNVATATGTGTGTGQSPTPASSQRAGSPHVAPSSAASTAGGGGSGVQSITVEVDGLSDAVAQVTLHIGLSHTRKKQIKFPFDFRSDNSYGVAAEMVKVLKLPDAPKTEVLIAVELESKLDPFRKRYFASMGGGPAAGGAAQPQQHQNHHQHNQHQHQLQQLQQTASPHPAPTLHSPNPANSGSPSSHHPSPSQQPQHFPLLHSSSATQLRLSSPSTLPHHLPSSLSQHSVSFNQPTAHPTLQHQPHLHQSFHSHHPNRGTYPQPPNAAASVSLLQPSHQPPFVAHSQPTTPAGSSAGARYQSLQSAPAVLAGLGGGSSQQHYWASPFSQQQQQQHHTQSPTSLPSNSSSPTPNVRRSTMPVQGAMPAVNATAASAQNRDGLPRSPSAASPSSSTPTTQQQQQQHPHVTHQLHSAPPSQSHTSQQQQQQLHTSQSIQVLQPQPIAAPSGGVSQHSVSQSSPDRRGDPTHSHSTANSTSTQTQPAHTQTVVAPPKANQQPQQTGAAKRDSATAADPTQSCTLPAPISQPGGRRPSQSNLSTHSLDSPDARSEEPQSSIRRSRSDLSHKQPSLSVQQPASTLSATQPTVSTAGVALSTQPAHVRSDSLHRLYSAMTVAQLKDHIRKKGGASRLHDCIEKKDLIDCLIELTPLSLNDPQSAPNSRPHSRHSSRPSSPEPLSSTLQSLNGQLGSSHSIGGAREDRDKDPFADLFTNTASHSTPSQSAHHAPSSNGHHTVAGGGLSQPTVQSSYHSTSHSYHDTPSPVSATSPRFPAPQLSPLASPDGLSPTRPAVQRPASIPTTVRSSLNRNTSHPLIAPNEPSLGRVGSPLMPSHTSSLLAHPPSAVPQSSILPSDPFAHLDATQHVGQHNTPLDWQEYFSDHADKQQATEQHRAAAVSHGAAAASTRQQQQQQQPLPHHTQHDTKVTASKASGLAAGRGGASDLSDFFDQPALPTLNGEFHKHN